MATSWMVLGSTAGARLGFSVSSAMDVNADGHADLALASRDASLDLPRAGAVDLYLGGPDGPGADPVWRGLGAQPDASFGESVAGIGDHDGDGFADLMVGAAQHQNQPGTGKIYVYRGQPDGLGDSEVWSAVSTQTGSWLGRWVSPAGDVDADGFADAVVGEKYYDTPALDAGRVLLFRGSAQGFAGSPSWEFTSDDDGAFLGFSVAGAGDVDGDGFGDVVAGASFADVPERTAGRVWLFNGSAEGLAVDPAWSGKGRREGSLLGYPVAAAGDVNGDGYPDVAAGAIGDGGVGRAVVWYGSTAGLPHREDWSATGEQVGEEFGYGVAGVGDLDGDGFDDLVVGARNYSADFENEGRVLIFRGGGSGLEEGATWSASSGQAGATLGSSVAGAGDVDGDGFPEFLVGAEYYDGSEENQGAVWLVGGVP